MFLASPRNSVAAQINLLNRLKCKTVLSPSPRPPPVTAILDVHQLHVIDIPSVQELLGKKKSAISVQNDFCGGVFETFLHCVSCVPLRALWATLIVAVTPLGPQVFPKLLRLPTILSQES